MKMDDAERHQRHHDALVAIQGRIDRMWQHAYENAKKHRNRAPRKFATHSVHSQRVSQGAAWRAHLNGFHGVPVYGPGALSPFISLAAMQEMHTGFHEQERSQGDG